MPFIIDGYNLLRKVQTANDGDSVSDAQLCMILDRFLKFVRQDGQIVFDGIGPPDKTPLQSLNILDVIFSGTTKDADTVIENKISASSAPKRLTIVSSDNRIRLAARKRKAVSIKSEAFWGIVQKELSKKRTPKEPAAKRDGLNDIQTEQWLEFFEFEQ